MSPRVFLRKHPGPTQMLPWPQPWATETQRAWAGAHLFQKSGLCRLGSHTVSSGPAGRGPGGGTS